jgi:hypothetical protein
VKERSTNLAFPPTDPTPVSVDELMERLNALQQRILARRGGKLLPPSAPLIRRAREERSARL